jgi:protein ImuA
MKRELISALAVGGKEELLRALAARGVKGVNGKGHCEAWGLRTGLAALDELSPGGELQGGAVHEVLWRESSPCPKSFAMLLARAAQNSCAGGGGGRTGRAVAWSDPDRELYLPAFWAAGIDLRRLLLLRCAGRKEQLWALTECMGCRGIGATVAEVGRLSQVEARRLQLAAERGGGIGVLMRQWSPGSSVPYAAATRWLVEPVAGDEGSQRWQVELLHGHGGRTGKVLLLEVSRETRAMRASAMVADRSSVPSASRATG